MRPYEAMIIFDATLEDDAIQAILDRATQLITDQGGTVGQVDKWGKRRFAYELNHRWEGYYVLVEFTAEPQFIAQLERMLKLADEVIRHKVIRLPEKVAGRQRRAASAPTEEPAEAGASSNGA